MAEQQDELARPTAENASLRQANDALHVELDEAAGRIARLTAELEAARWENERLKMGNDRLREDCQFMSGLRDRLQVMWLQQSRELRKLNEVIKRRKLAARAAKERADG